MLLTEEKVREIENRWNISNPFLFHLLSHLVQYAPQDIFLLLFDREELVARIKALELSEQLTEQVADHEKKSYRELLVVALGALKAVEWIRSIRDNSLFCPYCDRLKPFGHASNCIIGDAIAEIEEAVK